MGTRKSGPRIVDRPHGYKKYRAEKCRCEICCAENIEARRRYRPLKKQPPRLDATVFIERIMADDRQLAVSNNKLMLWRNNGIDVWAADRWACRLGYHPVEIWGQAFYEGAFDE